MRKHTTSKEVWSSEEEQHILAGQLSATDQSCRTVSHVLSEMSGNPQFDSLLISQVSAKSELDSCFLRGGAAEVSYSSCYRMLVATRCKAFSYFSVVPLLCYVLTIK
jgi:hypothetical protein